MWPIFNNKIVQLLLVVLVIVAICIIAGLNFHMAAGAGGLDLGVDRGTK